MSATKPKTIEEILALIPPADEALIRIEGSGGERQKNYRVFMQAAPDDGHVKFPALVCLAARDSHSRPGELRWLVVSMLGKYKADDKDLVHLKYKHGVAVDAGVFNAEGDLVGTWKPRPFSAEPWEDGRP